MTHIKTTHTPLPTPSKATRSRATMTRGTMSPVRRAIAIRKKEEEVEEAVEEATSKPTTKNPPQATSKIMNKKPTMMNQLIIQKMREAPIVKEEGANGKRKKYQEEDITGSAREEEAIKRKRATIRDMLDTVASSSNMEMDIMTKDMERSSSLRVLGIKIMEHLNIKTIILRVVVVATLLRAGASGRKKRNRNIERRRKQRQVLRKTGESIKSMETMGLKISRLRTMQD